MIDKLYGGSAKNLVASLVDAGKLTDSDVEELRSLFKVGDFRNSPATEVQLEEMQDGRLHIRKTYYNNSSLIMQEWDALVFLYNAGYNVPKPYKRVENSIYAVHR